MFLETFLLSFGAIILLEMGDKTQLIVLTLTTKYKEKKLAILLGFFLAIFIVSFIGVTLGNIIKELLPEDMLRVIGGIMFLIIGVYAFFDYYKDRQEPDKEEEYQGNRINLQNNGFKLVLTQTFGAIFLVEMGDKSQIFVITLATQYNDLFAIAIGATLAMTSLAIFAILLGEFIVKIIPENVIKIISGILFIAIGFIVLILE